MPLSPRPPRSPTTAVLCFALVHIGAVVGWLLLGDPGTGAMVGLVIGSVISGVTYVAHASRGRELPAGAGVGSSVSHEPVAR